MITNLIIIVAIVALLVYLTVKYVKKLDKEELDELEYGEDKSEIDIKYLVKETSEQFSKILRKRFEDENLTREELQRKTKRTASLREALTLASCGDKKSKRVVKNHIKDILSSPKYDLQNNIDNIIAFNDADKLKSMDKFEILLYLYTKVKGADGLNAMFDDYKLDKLIDDDGGEDRYEVSKEMIDNVYEDTFTYGNKTLGKPTLDFTDKLEVLAQRVYERYIGLGAIDMLYETTVDEIDCGVSGIPDGAFTIKGSEKNLPYSYESIWIMYHGKNVHMSCLSFGTQSELVRVCDNIYKYDAPYVLSRSEGRVVSTMMDGSRIVVCRPPFAESYSFFLRKFDSAPSTLPCKLIKDENFAIPICMMKWLIKGQRNIGITGSQGCGKTTMLKSFIRFIDPTFNLRIQELQFELNLRYAYPERNIETFQETANISAQEGLNLQKKTNGAVNIIGEVANAVQASHIIQTAMVASLFAMFTHHAKTAKDFVQAISNNLLELGLYKDKKDALAMTAKVLNIDCHLTSVRGNRHIERITEIIPAEDIPYPSTSMDSENMDKTLTDAREYFRRVTDAEEFTVRDLIKWEVKLDENGKECGGKFVLTNLPSEKMTKEICEKLTHEEQENFYKDMDMMKRLNNGEDTEEMKAWIEQVKQY